MLPIERIDAEAFARWGEMKGAPLAMCRGFARAIEAEVRASHAQTPAENEHVPAVVSANGAESNMTGAVPLTREQVKAICVESGYETATLQERADFINGIRHAERHHGIKGGQHAIALCPNYRY